MDSIRLLVVDDYPVVREGLCAMLTTDKAMEIVGEASDGIEALTMVEDRKPNVVLMDIRMPNMDGIEATRRIKDEHPSTAVIVLTMYDNDTYVIDAVQGGASGYLLKDASRELLLHTIRAVNSGATLIKTELLHEAICSLANTREGFQKPKVSPTQGLEALTPREHEVLGFAADGYTNKEIGRELGIAEDTVKKHMQNILAKLPASSRVGAVTQAARAGFIR